MKAGYAHGWFDLGAPAFVVAERDGSLACSQRLTVSSLAWQGGEVKRSGGLAHVYAPPATFPDPLHVLGSLFGGVATFVDWFREADTERAALVFVNHKPHGFNLRPRPPALAVDELEPLAAVAAFARAVQESIDGSAGMWSRCAWATLELRKG